MKNQGIEVRPVAGAIGAEILGPDLSEELSDEVVAAIRSVLIERCVVFFRDQQISDGHLARLACGLENWRLCHRIGNFRGNSRNFWLSIKNQRTG